MPVFLNLLVQPFLVPGSRGHAATSPRHPLFHFADDLLDCSDLIFRLVNELRQVASHDVGQAAEITHGYSLEEFGFWTCMQHNMTDSWST